MTEKRDRYIDRERQRDGGVERVRKKLITEKKWGK